MHRIVVDEKMNRMNQWQTIEFDGYAYRVDILLRIMQILQWMTTNNPRLLFVRTEVKFPQGYFHDGYNRELSALLHHLTEHYKYHQISFAYLWVREQSGSEVPHYHLIFLLDGNKTRDGRGVQNEAAKAWGGIVGMTGYDCVRLDWSEIEESGVRIRRPAGCSEGEKLANEREAFNTALLAALKWASYLAKTRTKGVALKGIREFGSSRIPKDAGPLSFPSFFPTSFQPYTPPDQWGN